MNRNYGISGRMVKLQLANGDRSAGEQWQYLRLLHYPQGIMKVTVHSSIGETKSIQYTGDHAIRLYLGNTDVQIYKITIDVSDTKIQFPIHSFSMNVTITGGEGRVMYTKAIVVTAGRKLELHLSNK